ncbi:MAG: hypothetical protein WA324_21535, partial [Bryobacteraceae bacterium]
MHLACSGLRDYVARNATLVVPSALLASAAREELSRFEVDSGRRSWERSSIYSVETWLERCWQEVRYDIDAIPALLSPAQELLLWRQLVEREHPDLFDLSACARGARDAARIMAQWHIRPDTVTAAEHWNGHQDGRQFLEWHRQFEDTCTMNGWMSRAHLWSRVPDWFAKGKLPKHETVLLGFDDWTPALQAIRQSSGAQKVNWETPSPPTRKSQSVYADASKEIVAAARWTRQAWESQPGSSIAVFIPELNEQRAIVERTFRSVLYPASAQNSGVTPGDSIFHVAAAAPLDTEPLIASALLFLELANPRLETSHAGAIFRSPFLKGAAAERSLRAGADIELRRRRDMDVSLRDLLYASRNCPVLTSTIWPSLLDILKKRPDKAELADWSRFISNLLQTLDWPGDNDPNEREQSLLDSWKSALSNLATLGMVAGVVPYDTALRHLRRLLHAPGPALGEWSSPIQILDASDAAGLSFDQACLTGLSEETWPPRQRLSPFIPMAVQRAHGIPGSSQDSARELSRRRTRALFQAAPILNISFCGRLAPIASQFLGKGSLRPEFWEGELPMEAFQPAPLECIEDSFGPVFTSSELMRGGAAVLK